MNKKLRPLICIALIIIISIPVISIAFAIKPDKGPIEKKVFIHRAKPDKPVKPPKTNGNDKEWYKYSGIHWTDLPVTYVVDDDLTLGVIVTSFETWDSETSTDLFVVESRDVTAGVEDGINALSYGDYPDAGVIAVTYISYYGDTGEIVEVDTLFDTDYTWGDATVNPEVMDLQNIATHEFGHWLVLLDLYKRPAREQTMYGYSTEGETSKRSLESGDIAGLEAIYGELEDN